jgi:hypothetical protein
MTQPSVEQEYRALLPRLLQLYPSGGVPAGNVRIRGSHIEAGHVAHGWYMRCQRGIQAVLMLEDAGFQIEAAPIRRSVLEHVVALKWLADQGSVVAGILRRGAAYDAKKRKEAVKAANWTSIDLDLFDAVIQDGEGIDPHFDNLLAFKNRCDKFGTPHDWTAYLAETAQCHPCWESAVPYLDITSGKPEARSTPGPLIDQAGFCTIHLFEALIYISQIVDSDGLSDALEDIEPLVKALVIRQRDERGLSVPAELRTSESA